MKRSIVSTLSLWTTILFVSILCVIVQLFVTDKLDAEYIRTNFIVHIGNFVPETSEKLQYMLSSIMFPIIYFIFYKLYKKIKRKASPKIVYLIVSTEMLVCATLFPIMYLAGDHISGYGASFYLMSPFIFVGCCILYKVFIKKLLTNDIFKNIFKLLLGLFFISCIIQIFKIQSYNPYFLPSPENFEAYFSPICKTVAGLTPGIDFYNLYGFYPYIYDMFFNAHNLTAHNLIFAFSVLTVITLLFFAIAFGLSIKNKYFAFFMYLFTITYSPLYGHIIFAWSGIFGKFYTPFYSYQYMPHRVIFVAFILMLISIFPKIQNDFAKNIVRHIGFLFCGLALFWNIESGIAALAGWSIYHLYLKPDAKNLAKVFLEVVAAILVFLFGVFIFTYMRSGQIINPLGLFFGQFVFYGKGFFMLKMDMFKQPYIPVILTYFIAIADAVRGYVNKNISHKNAFKISVGFIGLAVFVYFQGRSHVQTLIPCTYPAILLLAIFMEDWYKNAEKYKQVYIKIKKPLCNFLYKTYFVKFYAIFTIITLLLVNGVINIYKTHKIEESFILQNTIPMITGDPNDYDFLTEDASLLYMYFKIPNSIKLPSMPDLFYRSDADKVIEYLKQSNKKLIIDFYTIQKIMGHKPLADYIQENYIVRDFKGKVVIYVKKQK